MMRITTEQHDVVSMPIEQQIASTPDNGKNNAVKTMVLNTTDMNQEYLFYVLMCRDKLQKNTLEEVLILNRPASRRPQINKIHAGETHHIVQDILLGPM